MDTTTSHAPRPGRIATAAFAAATALLVLAAPATASPLGWWHQQPPSATADEPVQLTVKVPTDCAMAGSMPTGCMQLAVLLLTPGDEGEPARLLRHRTASRAGGLWTLEVAAHEVQGPRLRYRLVAWRVDCRLSEPQLGGESRHGAAPRRGAGCTRSISILPSPYGWYEVPVGARGAPTSTTGATLAQVGATARVPIAGHTGRGGPVR